MLTYKEYKNSRQAEFDRIPKFFVYDQKQYDEMLSKVPAKELVRINGLFYMQKKDKPLLDAYIHNEQLSELMKNKDFAIDAFLYEMQNHEYQYSYNGDFDVLNCFANKELTYLADNDYKEYLKEINRPEWLPWYEEARAKYLKHAVY